MPDCPCCSNKLLRHVKGKSSYWFCRSCWQKMPVFAVADRQQISSSPLGVSDCKVSVASIALMQTSTTRGISDEI